MRVFASNNKPFDLCRDCIPDEESAREMFGNMGDGPDGRGDCFAFDTDHPPYEFEDYYCHLCGETLTEEDS